MSAAPLRQQRAASAPRTQAPPRPHLQSVSAPEAARSLVPFATVCVATVVAALGAVLFINTTMAEGAYERRDLKIEIAGLHVQEEALRESIESNAAPANLAGLADDLGMAPATARGFMSLSDGIVVETGKQ